MATKKDNTTAAANGAAFESAARGLNGVRAGQHGAARLQEVAQQWRNTSPERLAGRLAEELHATSFNADAATKGLNSLKAGTGAANGAGTAAADVTIRNGARIIDQAQVKYHGTPASTAFDVAKVRYDGMQRVVPSDQAARVREIAAKRGVDGLGQRNYPDVAQKAADRIRSGGAESTPVSRAEALDAAKNTQRVAGELVGGRVVGAVKNGALAGAAVGGGISVVTNFIAFTDGKKSGEDAVVDAATDTATCAATGAAVSGLAVAAEAALVRAGAGALAGGAAPVAIGLTAVEMAKDVGRFINGDIDGEKFAGRAGGHVVKGSCTWGGMEGGAAIGTLICPGVGTVIGGILGGIGGGLFGGWLVD